MAQYGNFNKKAGRKKMTATAIAAVLVILAAIYVIGMFTDDNAEHISAAVRENVQLKEQVAKMSERITFLEAENEELRASLALVPTPAPSDEPVPEFTPEAAHGALPRGGR